MEAPFVYGRIADDLNFTDRKNEVALLTQNFKNLINTVIISPRRWGKTSLVNKCAKLLSEENKNTLVCQSIFLIVERKNNFIRPMLML